MTTEEKAIKLSKEIRIFVECTSDKDSSDNAIYLEKRIAEYLLDFHNSQPPNLDLINQITQLNKENQELKETKDNLKETLIKEVERSLRRLDININLEKQLQTAKDRIKELENGKD